VTAALCQVASRPALRYLVGCAGLVLMLAAPVVTMTWLSAEQARASAAISVLTRGDRSSDDSGGGATAPSHSRLEPASRSLPRAARIANAPAVMPFVVVCWLAGVAILLGRLLFGWQQVKRLHAFAVSQPPSMSAAVGERLARQLGLP